jgi:chromosome partitioning protein
MAKKILICNQKGGVGKSAIIYYLGLKFQSVTKVAFVDVDYQGTLTDFKENSKIDTYVIDEMSSIDEDKYDFIFIDTPPYLTEYLPKLIESADFIIIPTKIGLPDFYSMKKIVDIIKLKNKEKDSLIVYNMVEQNTTILNQIENVLDNYGINIAKNRIHNRIAYQRGYITLTLEGKAQKEIDDLAIEVLAHLNK